MSSLSGMKNRIARAQGAPKSANQKDTLEGRITRIEGVLARLIQSHTSLSASLKQLAPQYDQLALNTAALVELYGLEAVQAKVTEIQRRGLEADAQMYADRTAAAVKNGELVVAETVEPGYLAVFEDRDAEGNLRVPSVVHAELDALDPVLAAAVKGKRVGDKISVNHYNITILAVYKAGEAPVVVPAATKAVMTDEEAQRIGDQMKAEGVNYSIIADTLAAMEEDRRVAGDRTEEAAIAAADPAVAQ